MINYALNNRIHLVKRQFLLYDRTRVRYSPNYKGVRFNFGANPISRIAEAADCAETADVSTKRPLTVVPAGDFRSQMIIQRPHFSQRIQRFKLAPNQV